MMMYSMTPFGRNNSLSNFFDNFDRHFFGGMNTPDFTSFRTDIREDGDHYVLDADLPGFDREDIHLELQGDVLTITAQHNDEKEDKDEEGKYIRRERVSGSCARSFYVGDVRPEDIRAKYEDGVLKLSFPKENQRKLPEQTHIAIE